MQSDKIGTILSKTPKLVEQPVKHAVKLISDNSILSKRRTYKHQTELNHYVHYCLKLGAGKMFLKEASYAPRLNLIKNAVKTVI